MFTNVKERIYEEILQEKINQCITGNNNADYNAAGCDKSSR